jgi:hypothetical protein
MTEESKYPTDGLKSYLDGDAPGPFYFYDVEAKAPEANGRIIAWSGYWLSNKPVTETIPLFPDKIREMIR